VLESSGENVQFRMARTRPPRLADFSRSASGIR